MTKLHINKESRRKEKENEEIKDRETPRHLRRFAKAIGDGDPIDKCGMLWFGLNLWAIANAQFDV